MQRANDPYRSAQAGLGASARHDQKSAAQDRQGQESLRRDKKRVAWSTIGLGALFVWEFYKNARSYPAPEWAPLLHPYGVASAVLILLVVTFRRTRPETFFLHAKVVDIACAAAALASTCVFSRTFGFVVPTQILAGSLIVADLALGWLYARWIVVVSSLSTMEAAAAVIAACSLASAVKMILPMIPNVISALVCALLGAGAGIGLFAVRPSSPTMAAAPAQKSQTEISGAPYRPRSSWGPLLPAGICIASFTLTYAIVNMLMKVQFGSFAFGDSPLIGVGLVGRALELAVCCAAAWQIFMHKGTFSFVAMWRILVALITAALLSVIVVHNSPTVQMLTSPAIMLLTTFFVMIAADVVRHSRINPLAEASCGLLFFMIPSYLGRLAVQVSGAHELTISLSLVLLALITIVTSCFATSYSTSMRGLLAELNGRQAPLPQDFDAIERRCAEAGALHGLSDREVEVMQLLVKGRSKPYIAEALYISENTVRTYAKRIYSKLDVHSKQELQDRICV